MGNVVTFVKLMESAGMGRVTGLGKVIAKQGDDVIREAVFANGKRGTYRVSNFMGTKTQSVFDGQRAVEFVTSKGEESYFRGALYANGRYVEPLPTMHSWKIKETINGQADAMQTLANGRARIIPWTAEYKKVNGELKPKVVSSQDIQTSTKLKSNKGFGTIYEHKEINLTTDRRYNATPSSSQEYFPESNPGIGKDLSKKPIYYSSSTGYKTQYTGQTPVDTLNRDLGANFQTPLKPLWSKVEEMLWKLT